jgi:hypothetical protein
MYWCNTNTRKTNNLAGSLERQKHLYSTQKFEERNRKMMLLTRRWEKRGVEGLGF